MCMKKYSPSAVRFCQDAIKKQFKIQSFECTIYLLCFCIWVRRSESNVWHDSHIIWCIAHFSMILKHTRRLNACVLSHSTRSQSFLFALRRSNIKWRLTIKILSISHVYAGMIDLSGFRNDEVQFALCESVWMRISGEKNRSFWDVANNGWQIYDGISTIFFVEVCVVCAHCVE